MQPKTIKIDFNKEHFFDSQKIIWAFSNRKNLRIYKIFTIWAIILLGIHFLNKNNNSSVEAGILYGYSFYIVMNWLGLLERRIRFLKKRKLCATRFEKESMECTYILDKDELQYQDKEKMFKLNWSLFNPYIIFKETILLIAKDNGGITFTLSRKELGETDYQEVCNILNEKISRV